MRQAKIVCTLGPATSGYDKVRDLIEAGMDVARVNFSHGDYETHRRAVEDVRRASADTSKPIAIIADLSGPKIRLGEVENGGVEVPSGSRIRITTKEVLGNPTIVGSNYPNLPRDVLPGTTIYIDDGNLEFSVVNVSGEELDCLVRSGGIMKSRKGLNIPRANLSISGLTEKDEMDIQFGRELKVDYFALSFVRRPFDVIRAKSLAGDIPVIAKIEKPEAIDYLAEIADVADGLMVARGDLGIEIGFERVPLLQKRMIREMNLRAKPVITATQMLESMVQNPQPTRAEVSDVANAVLDGTDAVMLSAESAAGKYPFHAVRTMARIIKEVESTTGISTLMSSPERIGTPSFGRAIAHSAARTAIDLGLKAVAVFSETGRSAALVSAYRPRTTIVGFSPNMQTIQRMALLWGVVPVFGEWADGVSDIVERSEEVLLRQRLADPGDTIAITFGLNDSGPVGTTMLKLWKIRGD
ncbi:MAG: pyruvate kinase [Planctomycetota bacterium]